MFTPEERQQLSSEIIDFAKKDPRITGGAITGSASCNREDKWSDIDLAFGVRDATQVLDTLKDFTAKMYDEHNALHHLDVHRGPWIYRVFLLESTLQVDIAFAPESEFGALAPTFNLCFGTAKQVPQTSQPSIDHIVGWAWLYALHARSCIARRKSLQAEYMISAMRDQVIALSCLRLGLPTRDARGADQLSVEILGEIEKGLVKSLDSKELQRAFQSVTQAFLAELGMTDKNHLECLEAALKELSGLSM